MLKPLSSAISDLALKRQGGIEPGVPRRARITRVFDSGAVTVTDKGVERSLFMGTDQPQRAGTNLWIMKTDKEEHVGLGQAG